MPKKKKKKDREGLEDGSLQFFLEDELSIVTTYFRIGSQCKVSSIFQSESELSIQSLLSH